MRTFGILALLFALGCGGRERPPVELATKEQVRDFYALNADSCWLYRFNDNLRLSITVSAPNDRVIAGKTVYIMKFNRLTGGGLPDEWYLDAETRPEIRLLRSVVGASEDVRMTSRYETTGPLFAKFELDAMKQAILEVGERFETETTPLDKDGNALELEQHRWTVQSNTEMVTTSDGEKTAVTLDYRKNGTPSTWWLVPGYGFAKFQSFDGTTYQVCDARVCDSTGACTGAPDCQSMLDCPR
jgi:hypothetical protein